MERSASVREDSAAKEGSTKPEAPEMQPEQPGSTSGDPALSRPESATASQDGRHLASPSPPPESGSMLSGSNDFGEATMTLDPEQLEALQASTAEVQNNLQALEAKIEDKLAWQREEIVKLQKSETEYRAENASVRSLIEERRVGQNERAQKMGGDLEAVRQRVENLESDETMKDAIHDIRNQLSKVEEKAGQAAVAHIVEPKIVRLGKNLEELTQAGQKSDKQLETTAQNVSQLYQKLDSYSQQLSQVALRTEVDDRCFQLDHQSRTVTGLLKDVEVALGDISAAIVSLSSKAEQADLALVRDELSVFAEKIADREQSVLFGAKCLSCNRVFDEVCKEAGSGVDLPIERQRDALFAQVQRALHSPNNPLDPMAKIKMLAIKVGRHTSLSGKAGPGTYEGRDTSGLTCGTADMQLIPTVRGCSATPDDGRISATPTLPRPGTTPRTSKRHSHGRTDAWQASRKDGPLDYIHPLSQLVDRTQRSGRATALG